ncbi:MAG: rRNA adenine methyltransferase [Chitinophagaceae bacterium]|nr:rRNA adenine methyltransferase [Chitinophagaceae bacterium]
MQQFIDPENRIVQLCAAGMEQEGAGNPEAAKALFLQAWHSAGNALEQCIAAHYLARQQDSIAGKLVWDVRALACARAIHDDTAKGAFPSLYLNIAKGYEDLGDRQQAQEHYRMALSFASFLAEDGYGKMILSGIEAGLKRMKTETSQ